MLSAGNLWRIMLRRYRTDGYIAAEDHHSALPNQQSVIARPKFVADALEQAKVAVPAKQIRCREVAPENRTVL